MSRVAFRETISTFFVSAIAAVNGSRAYAVAVHRTVVPVPTVSQDFKPQRSDPKFRIPPSEFARIPHCLIQQIAL